MTLTLDLPAETAAADYRVKALRSLGKLPPFSPVLTRLMATLADEDVSFGEVSDVIEKDTVMAGNVLRMVKSSLYAWRGTINSVRHAVSLMGVAKLRNTVMTLSVTRMLSSKEVPATWSPSKFNLHAAATAILADLFAAEMDIEYPEGAFAAGLLQNVGMLLIAIGLPREHARIRELCEAGGFDLLDAERHVIGFDHAGLSADVLRQWNLPAAIQQAVADHHGPHIPGELVPLSQAVELSDQVAKVCEIPVQPWVNRATGSLESTLARLGLTDRMDRILQAFDTEYQITGTFFQ